MTPIQHQPHPVFDIPVQFTKDGVTSSYPLISRVFDDLYLGGARAWRLLDLPDRFAQVVRLTADHAWGLPGGAVEHVLEINDDSQQGLEQAWALAEMVAESSGPILVHCQMGLNRSGAVMARALMLRNGWSSQQAVDHLRDVRSEHVLFNQSFRDQLAEFDEE